MSDRIPSIADITDWLINNPTKTNKRGRKVPTGVPDAARALGYKGPPLKIREGNLTNGRQNLRISLKGKSSQSDYFRAQAQARTTPDKSVRAGANQKIKSINRQSSVINTADHILSNGALANGEEFVRATRGEEGVREMRARYKKAGVGYGHSKENIQGLTNEQNGKKEVQERILRGNNRNKTAYLQHLEDKPPVTSPEFQKWDQKRQQFANKINLANVNIENLKKASPALAAYVSGPAPKTKPTSKGIKARSPVMNAFISAYSSAMPDSGFGNPGDQIPYGGRTISIDPLFTGATIRLP